MHFILFIHQFVLFFHLIAFAVAFATLLREDIALFTSAHIDIVALESTKKIIKFALIALWISGLILVTFSVGTDILSIFDNPKLLAKITVVSALTINGFLLHSVAFPLLTSPQRFPQIAASVCCLLGAVSTVSWTYASFIGVARLIRPVMSYNFFIALYIAGLAIGCIVAVTFVRLRLVKMIEPLTRPAYIHFSQIEKHLPTVSALAFKASNNYFQGGNGRP